MILAVLPLCGFLLSGCGGNSSGAAYGSPALLAPSSLAGHTLIFVDPNQTQFSTTYVFATGTYTSPSGDSGTYTYQVASSNANQATVNIVSAFVPAITDTLTFTSGTGGTFVNQVAASGTFTMQ
jgi:hypothetical protein